MHRKTNIFWQENRPVVFTVVFVAIYALIGFRLFAMQVINRPNFLKKSEANRIRVEAIEPSRGGIFDHDGNLLVENRPSYTVFARPWTIKKNPATISLLSQYLEIPAKTLRERIGKRGWYSFSPIPVQHDIEFPVIAALEVRRVNFPGVEFGLEAKRAYPLPEAVHLLGYVGERSKNEDNQTQGRFGLVGKHGMEVIYEEWLGGKAGVRYVQVDVSGKTLGAAPNMPSIPAENGGDVYLNIDGDLQRLAYELMDGRVGAVVAIRPDDGGILTLLSLPDYDPSIFSGVMSQETWKDISTDPGHPLLNRALQGQYPPGSTFKMVNLAAGIEEGLVNDRTTYICNGGLQIGNRFFSCWRKGGHGVVDQKKSIKESCDVFYYNVGMDLGADRMADYARRFGFGSVTGVDFDVEKSGIAPDSKYLDIRYGKGQWTRGQEANISIGQGDVLVTPIQLAVFTAAIGTGYVVKPRIADRLVNKSTGETQYIHPSKSKLDISESTRLKLKENMRSVVNEAHGTAYWLRRWDMVFSGKTGTAQNPHGEDHALFVGFAPFDEPKIAVAVVVENGEHGSTAAAPIVCKMMEEYLLKIYPGPRPPRPRIVIKPVVTDSLSATPADSLESVNE